MPPKSHPRPGAASWARLSIPSVLPISKHAGSIQAELERSQILIVVGATGSGKTTQLPKLALMAGRGSEGLVGVTQPRRIAATSVAQRVAEELSCTLGQEVGYQIRFENRTDKSTRLKFMTDGILLAEIQQDPLLRHYDTLIIDEAHERSLNIDFLLGWLKRIVKKRPDLKVIISSATIEADRFSEFFFQAPVMEVEGKTFPVDVLYEPPDLEDDLAAGAARAVQNIAELDPDGNILVFLPGEREIHETEKALNKSPMRRTVVQPLFARLAAADQRKVFAEISERRVILATNVAETSLTLPGIVYVVDTGVARLSRYDASTGTTRLHVEPISQASANQRKGRCGRVRDGICVRLYDEEDFDSRPAFTDPEMVRVSLAGVILRMKALGLGEVEHFPFLDSPTGKAIAEGYRTLEELGAIDSERKLTPLGRQLTRFPVDPRIGRMILAGQENGVLEEVLVVAAALNIQDPRERPRAQEDRAKQAHRRFFDAESDFVSWLKLWEFVVDERRRGSSNLRRACKANFLSFVRVREWLELHRQLKGLAQDSSPRRSRNARARPSKAEASQDERPRSASFGANLHISLLSGMLSRIGQYDPEKRAYLGARQTRFVLHPGSGVAKKPPAWVMSFELVQTSRLFARNVAKLNPDWLEPVGGHLLKRKHSEPHWHERSGRAIVKEQATLYGLMVYRERRVDYATLSRVRARLMFIEHALVRGEYLSKAPFHLHNAELRAEATRLSDKARQSDMLTNEDSLLEFFDSRLPPSVVDSKSFGAFRKNAEAEDPRVFYLSLELLFDREHPLRPEDYPDTIRVQGFNLDCTYCFDPLSERDGITLRVPLAALASLIPEDLNWTIVAWQELRILSILERLPKADRKSLPALPTLAKELASDLTPFSGPFLPQFLEKLQERTFIRVAPNSVFFASLPGYLQTRCEVLDEQGQPLGDGKDLAALFEQFGIRAQALATAQLEQPAAVELLRQWGELELPETEYAGLTGLEPVRYAALQDQGSGVKLVYCPTQNEAIKTMRGGVRRLLALELATELKSALRRLPTPPALASSNARGTPPIQFSEDFLLSVVDDTFGLSSDVRFPRTGHEYRALLEFGKSRLADSVQSASLVAENITSEVLRYNVQHKQAQAQPGGRKAAAEAGAQIERLFADTPLPETPIHLLAELPRYIAAARVRLQRAVHDPKRDAERSSTFHKVAQEFERKAQVLSAEHPHVRRLRWTLEELRIALFAPEMKPAMPVTPEALSQALRALR